MRGELRALEGGLALCGVIDMHVGAELRGAARRLLAAGAAAEVTLDCAGIEQSSSVGLSLLLCLLRDAQATGKRLRICNLSADLRQVAEVYGLLELLPLAD